MGVKKRTIFHETIKSPEHYEEIVEKSLNGGPIAIIDAFLSWCGPCDPMIPNYASLFFSYDEPESRLSFWHFPEENMPEGLAAKLKLNVIPRFFIVANGSIKTIIEGAKYNELVDGINANIPEGPED